MTFFLGEPFTRHADLFGTTVKATEFKAGEDCEESDDCPEGNKCSSGKCVQECKNDNDCPSWHSCIGGVCKEEDESEFKDALSKSQDTEDDSVEVKSRSMNPLTLGIIGIGVVGVGLFLYNEYIKGKMNKR